MECFTAEFLQLFAKKRPNVDFRWMLGTWHQVQAFQGFS